MKRICFLIEFAILIFQSNSFAMPHLDPEDQSLNIKFGGWSHHAKSFKGDDYNYNENHNGYGIEWTFLQNKSKQHALGLGFWHMQDSYNFPEKHYGLTYRYRPDTDYEILNKIDFNLSAYWIQRSFRVIYPDTKELAYFENRDFGVIHPYITLNLTSFLNVDIIYIPRYDKLSVETWFIRGGINLTNLSKYIR